MAARRARSSLPVGLSTLAAQTSAWEGFPGSAVS
jgi:hypothetical protein